MAKTHGDAGGWWDTLLAAAHRAGRRGPVARRRPALRAAAERGWVVAALFVFVAATAHARTTTDLNAGWKFLRSDAAGAAAPAFDDAAWPSVQLPHTWNAADGQDGGNNYYRGPAWYRCHLRADPGWAGHEVYLRFGACSTVADVYVNGKAAGRHAGAFGAFCFDVTPLLDRDGNNVVAVRATNAHDPDVAPLSADFTFFGGLYRGAQVVVTDPLSVSPTDDGGSGVLVRQDAVSAASAKLTVTTTLSNATGVARAVNVRCQVLDGDRVVAGATSGPGAMTARTTFAMPLAVEVPTPHLWDGRRDPFRYTVRVTVSDEAGHTTDVVEQPVGLRSFRVDPQRGFFLNGRPYPLHGVCRHQDHLDEGWAVTAADEKLDFANLYDMGCTAVRLAHYQQSPSFYDLCDAGGVVVWAEIPLVNHVTDSPAFDAGAAQQLRELIKQNYNHPAICFWGLSNELNTGGLKDEAKAAQQRHQEALQESLNRLAKDLDATRPTTSASLRKPGEPLDAVADLIAFNWYGGWYYGKATDWPKYLDSLHKAYPDRPVGVSEYGAGASVAQHEADPARQPKSGGKWHPEEWQADVHEQAWAAMKDRPYLWCEFVWCLHDFAADQRGEGDHAGRNDKGLVTYDGKTRKDGFYFYQANWSEAPMVHVAGRRFTPRVPGATPVKVYSNCDGVELRVNGRTVGTVKPNEVRVALFPAVELSAGENRIEAVGTRGGQAYTDAVTIVGDPAATTRP